MPGLAKVLGQPRNRKAAAHFGLPWRGPQFLGIAEFAAYLAAAALHARQPATSVRAALQVAAPRVRRR